MQNSAEALKLLEKSLIKYERSKTELKKEDLEGKYKTAFTRLKKELSEELSAYANYRIIEIFPEATLNAQTAEELIKIVLDDCKKNRYTDKIRDAAYKDYDLQAIISITEEARERIKGKWAEFYRQNKDRINLKEAGK